MEPTTKPQTGPTDGKKVFKEKRTCSRTFFYLLNREFGHLKPTEERASDALAGGIMQEGHQCGMLWGASLAIGAEAYRACDDLNQAIRVAIRATQNVMRSFRDREGTINCRAITDCDFHSKVSFAKYMLSGRYRHCFELAQEWAPQAVRAARQGMEMEIAECDDPCLNCAAEVARKMGASEEELAMVAGFAGGLGLSGAGCGALAAAIWLKSLQWCREEEGTSIKNPYSKNTLEAFYKATDSEISCERITGRKFNSLAEHSEFLKEKGCAALLDTLAAHKCGWGISCQLRPWPAKDTVPALLA